MPGKLMLLYMEFQAANYVSDHAVWSFECNTVSTGSNDERILYFRYNGFGIFFSVGDNVNRHDYILQLQCYSKIIMIAIELINLTSSVIAMMTNMWLDNNYIVYSSIVL